jgi:hypothetical protein
LLSIVLTKNAVRKELITATKIINVKYLSCKILIFFISNHLLFLSFKSKVKF